jgi:hypothetical protein
VNERSKLGGSGLVHYLNRSTHRGATRQPPCYAWPWTPSMLMPLVRFAGPAELVECRGDVLV